MNDSKTSRGVAPQPARRGGGALVSALGLLTLGLLVVTLLSRLNVAPDVDLAHAVTPPAQPPLVRVDELMTRIGRPDFAPDEAGRYVQQLDDLRVVYTLDPALQRKLTRTFARYKVPYGAFVALEPATGRVLAMAEYSADDPEADDLCLTANYPAASLIKVVTAAAALETGEVSATSNFRYEGNPYRMTRRKIARNNKRRYNRASFADALGHSNNLIFGEVGADVVGWEGFTSALTDFGFNRTLPFELPLQPSRALVPQERYSLARTAAGLGKIRISPVHAALIAAAVGNDGVMMQPYLIDRVEDDAGSPLYVGAPRPLGRSVSAEVANELAAMMETTVKKGTSTRTFYRKARRLVDAVDIAGKTGSLTGNAPPGRYEWFIGFAPADDPQIAVAALVVNRGDLWHIKGTDAAMTALREHFDL